MKIYTRVVMDIETMEIESEESFEYEGDLALCGGGGGGLLGGITKVLFGDSSSSSPETVTTPEVEDTPTYEEEAEPEAKSVRDREAAKIRARRGLAGTILTSPLGTSGGSNILGV